MINNLLYAKLPPHLKRSINISFIENRTYEEIIQHVEGELEYNGLEGDNVTAIIINTTQNTYTRLQNQPFYTSNVVCLSCKEKGHFVQDWVKLKGKNERKQRSGITPFERWTFPPCVYCGLTNQPCERPKWYSNNERTISQPNNGQPTTSQSRPSKPEMKRYVLNNPLHLNLASHTSALR